MKVYSVSASYLLCELGRVSLQIRRRPFWQKNLLFNAGSLLALALIV